MSTSTGGSACSAAKRGILQLLGPPEVHISKRFFPRDKLYTFLQSRVRQILDCGCHTCAQHLILVGPSGGSVDQYIHKILGTIASGEKLPDYNSSAITIFSLFIAIGYPALTRTFLDKGHTDAIFQAGPSEIFSQKSLHKLWPRWDAVEFKWEFFDPMESRLPHFAVPHLLNADYTTYDSGTILPFVEEKRKGRIGDDGEIIDEGAYGKVFSFKIHPCYNKLGYDGLFARKELDGNAPLRFALERDNLETVKILESANIVQMIKTYKHGESFNIIFPCAKTDLNHYLRDNDQDSDTLRQGPLEYCLIWKQALGISKALASISSIETKRPSSSASQQLVPLNGFHFDLKPANILVDHDNSWLITDFGLARFEPADGLTSRVINQPGTDAYAPPENLNMDAKFSRRYDVWSLGCILLEVTAFAVRGQEGLRALDEARRTVTRHRIDHRFFEEAGDGRNGFVLKPTIVKFKESLLLAERASPDSSKRFLQELLDIIEKMLEPVAQKRIDISNVILKLSPLMSTMQSPSAPTAPYSSLIAPFTAEGEHDRTTRRLRKIICSHLTLDGSPKGNWRNAQLSLFGDNYGGIRIVASDPNGQYPPANIELYEKDVQLVPGYAFPSARASDKVNDINIKFERIDNGKPYFNGTFHFFDYKDFECFQSILTHQEVKHTFAVKDVMIYKYTDMIKKILNSVRKKEEGRFAARLGPAIVQLQNEDGQAFDDSRRRALTTPDKSYNPVRERPHEELVAPYRIVIFVQNIIITILLKPGLRNLKERPKGLDPTISRFVPTDPHKDRFLQVAVLHPSRKEDGTYAGIPLNVGTLRQQELLDTFDSKTIDFFFNDDDERGQFEKAYYDFKNEWRRLRKEAEGTTRMPRRQKHSHHGRGGIANIHVEPEAPVAITGVSSSTNSTHSRGKGKAKAEENGDSEIHLEDPRGLFGPRYNG